MTGSLLGVDNDVASFLCEGLQCGSFLLRNPLDGNYDIYISDKQKWIGGIAELIAGTSTFKVGFLTPPPLAFSDTSFTGFAYQIEEGFSTGYPLPIASLFNVMKPFE